MIDKIKKSKITLTLTSKGTDKIISEEDIRKRAFEISQEDDDPSFTELDNWCFAERELRGYYR